jgi:hypothetical protein
MEDVRVKLNPVLPRQNSVQQVQVSFHQQTGRKFKEETSKLLHSDDSFLWC